MGTNTTRLQLWKPDGSPGGDNIDVDTDINDNADIIDDAVGMKVCTSGTRPTGAQRWDGRQIYETDTRRAYMWQETLGFWMPLIIGRGSEVGPYLLGTSTDTSGEGFNISGSVAGANVWRSRVTSEANPRFTLNADGEMNWGAGGASAVDTRLYRSAADTLRTPDSLTVDANLTVSGTAAWNKLSEQTPTGTTCTFSSIPQTYRHLKIVGSGRCTTASTFVVFTMQFNGSASALYDNQLLTGNNTGVSGSSDLNGTSGKIGEIAAASATAGACAVYEITIFDYRSTAFWKTWQVHHTLSVGSGASSMHARIWDGQYRGTAAITSITLLLASGNFATGSIFSLYGLL